MIVVQDLLGAAEVLGLAGGLLPRHADQPLDVVAGDRRLGRNGRHRLEAAQLLLGFLADFLGHAGRLDLLLEVLDLVGPIVLAAELLVDGLDLFVEVVLLLGLLHLLLDLVVDPAVDVDLVDLDLQQVLELLETLVGRLRLEQRLLLGGGHGKVRRQRVGEALGIVDLEGGGQALEGQVVRELRVLLEQREDLGHVVPQAVHVRRLDREQLHADRQELAAALERHDPAAAHALDHDLDVPVRELQRLGHRRDDAHLVNVLGFRLVELGVLLGRQEQALGGGRQGRLEGPDRRLAAHDEGLHHVGKDHHVPQGYEREHLQRAAGAIHFH